MSEALTAPLWVTATPHAAHLLQMHGAEAVDEKALSYEKATGRRLIVTPSATRNDPERDARGMAARLQKKYSSDCVFVLPKCALASKYLDISDYLESAESEGDAIDLEQVASHAVKIDAERAEPPKRIAPEIINARDLMAKEFKPVSYLVDNLLPEGAYLLAGRPKIGKSWLALQIAIDVARGVDCMGRRTAQGDVLYLGLEDNQRRMQSRLKALAPASDMPTCFEVALWWRRLNEGGIDDLLAWANRVKQPRFISVDTIAKVRAVRGRGDDPYTSDYAVGEALKKVSDSIPGLTILAVTHIRKADAEDVLDKISGTLGLSGAFDGAAVLDRKRGGAEGTLKIVGRDLENDIDLGVSWESELTQWRIVGDADEVRASAEQRRILACLRDATEPLLPREIAEETGLSRGSVRHLIRKLHTAGMVSRIAGTNSNHRYTVK